MGVEAARLALRAAPEGTHVDGLWFSTADPAYLDKTNATAIHAALRLDSDAAAFDLGGAARTGVGALRLALDGIGTTLVVTSDLRTGLPTSPDESAGGDGGGRAARRRRRRDPRDRRVPRRRHRDRGVPRPVAHTGGSPIQGVGGAVRRDEVPAAR